MLLETLVAWLFAAACVGCAILLWRSRPSAVAAPPPHVLEYSLAWRLGTTISAVLIPSAWAIERWIAGASRLVPSAFLFSAAALLGAALETWRVRIRVDEDALTSRSPWRPTRRISWDEVVRVRWSHFMQAWSIESASARVWASASLEGVSMLAGALLSRVPSERIDASAAARLRRASERRGR